MFLPFESDQTKVWFARPRVLPIALGAGHMAPKKAPPPFPSNSPRTGSRRRTPRSSPTSSPRGSGGQNRTDQGRNAPGSASPGSSKTQGQDWTGPGPRTGQAEVLRHGPRDEKFSCMTQEEMMYGQNGIVNFGPKNGVTQLRIMAQLCADQVVCCLKADTSSQEWMDANLACPRLFSTTAVLCRNSAPTLAMEDRQGDLVRALLQMIA